jgi:hypothetical protein
MIRFGTENPVQPDISKSPQIKSQFTCFEPESESVLLTRPMAAVLAVFVFNAVLFHAPKGFWNMGGYEYPLVWMVLCLAVVIKGIGCYSFDAKIEKEF